MQMVKSLVSTLCLVIATSVFAQVELGRSVNAAGGGSTASAGHALAFTVGQPAVGLTTDGTYQLSIGFWMPGLGSLVAAPGIDIPESMSLDQNYPNPFNPMTVIRFGLPEQAPVTLAIYNVRGERVRLLADEQFDAGHHEVVWNGADDAGRSVSSGTYIARIMSTQGVENRKMVLAR